MAKVKRYRLTQKRIDRLRAEKMRTGLGPIALLKAVKGLPEALRPVHIDNWMNRRALTANAAHYLAVIKAWRSIPDRQPNRRRPIVDSPHRIPVSDALRRHIRYIHQQAPQGYLYGAPEGLTGVSILHIINGRDKTISREALEFLQSRYAKIRCADKAGPEIYPDLKPECLPPWPPSPRKKRIGNVRKMPGAVYVPITDELYHTLHRQQRRTLISAARLVKNGQNVPAGLRPHTASQWLLGVTLSAEEHYLRYVLDAYAALPTLHPDGAPE